MRLSNANAPRPFSALWILLSALLVGACSTNETVLRLDQSLYLVEASTLKPERDGAFLENFQRRALYQAAKTTRANGGDLFRIIGQKRHAYLPPAGGILAPIGGAVIFIPIPTRPRLPPGEDTERYQLWVELLDSKITSNPDNLPIYSAAALLKAWPNIGQIVTDLESVPENNSFVDLGGGDVRRRGGD